MFIILTTNYGNLEGTVEQSAYSYTLRVPELNAVVHLRELTKEAIAAKLRRFARNLGISSFYCSSL